MAKIERLDTKGSMMTTFIISHGNQSSEFQVPIDQADDYETKIQLATKVQLVNLLMKEGRITVKEL